MQIRIVRFLMRLALLAFAGIAAGCDISFTPDIEPLVLATLPAQPFGSEVPSEQLQLPPEDALPSISPQVQPFDPDDPTHWIALIEEEWDNVDVISCMDGDVAVGCVEWTAEEAELLYETLSDHLLADYLDSTLFLVRTESDGYSGLATSWAIDEDRASELRISDHAWRSPPAAGLFDLFDPLFRRDNHFQGTIAHELTHAAVWFHPELLDWWIDAQAAAGEEITQGDWRVGYRYDWSVYDEFEADPELYEDLVQGELFALTIAALMYDPWWGQGE